MAVALFAGLSASRAKADSTNVVTTTVVDNFDLVIDGNTYTWNIPVPTAISGGPVLFDGMPIGFDITDLPYTFNGQSTTAAILEVYNSDAPVFPGGFVLGGGLGGGLSTEGPVIFSGSASAPVFALGTITGLEDINTGAMGTLTVTQSTLTTPTPEPSTLLLTGIGIFALFWFARKKKVLNLAV